MTHKKTKKSVLSLKGFPDQPNYADHHSVWDISMGFLQLGECGGGEFSHRNAVVYGSAVDSLGFGLGFSETDEMVNFVHN